MVERVVLTTGANSGLGLETARRGFRSIGSVRSEEKAEVVARTAKERGVGVETVLLDVADPEQCERVVSSLKLYGLVNNAGYMVTAAVDDVTDEEARTQLETMVVAPIRLARLALPAMREAGDGRIVNVSSVAALMTVPLLGWYQACKDALEALSDALRIEVATAGIKVVVIEPGVFRTGIFRGQDQQVEERAGSPYAGAYKRSLAVSRLAQIAGGDSLGRGQGRCQGRPVAPSTGPLPRRFRRSLARPEQPAYPHGASGPGSPHGQRARGHESDPASRGRSAHAPKSGIVPCPGAVRSNMTDPVDICADAQRLAHRERQAQPAVTPWSLERMAPWMLPASSEARKANRAAMSSGCPGPRKPPYWTTRSSSMSAGI